MLDLKGTQLFSAFDENENVKHGLPSAAYTSKNFYELESKLVFAKSWTFAGFAHDLAKVGDITPLDVAGQPLILVRSSKNKIRAFYNVCRHRNLKLVDKPRNCKSLITCPYHNWCYNLDGQLRATPFFGGQKTELPKDFKLKDHSLLEVPCEFFHDWIFVNLNCDTVSFESHIAPMKKQLAGIDLDDFVVVASIEFGEIKSNWKLLMENFIEPYHVQFVHKKTTNQPLEDHYVVSDGHCLGSAVDLTSEQQEKAQEGTLSVSSRYLTLFPNFVLGVYYPDQIGVHLNQPVSAEITCQRRVIYQHKDSDQSTEVVEKISRLWESVHKEDHAMCERLQEGRHSDAARQGGFLSPYWESSVRSFQELVADAIRPALNH
jgi:choline monooxygenase